jgi:hypothetical protein
VRDGEKERYWSGLWANRITSNFLPPAHLSTTVLISDWRTFMIPQFDIFRMKKREYLWLEATMTLDDAEARVQELGAAEPGGYLIFNQKTCGRISLTVEP